MGSSNHRLSSSSPIRPYLIPRISASDAGEINENDQNSHKMGSNLKSPKKSTKHFMSPTISAASKAVVPRKKILAERNESSESIFSDTHVEKPPKFDPKPSLAGVGTDSSNDSLSPVKSLSSGESQFDDQDQKTLVSNSSSKPYDPLTNYLSPRPKFLRYNPNRRREIFLRHENETKETEDGTNSDESGSFDSKNFVVEETTLSASGSSDSSSEEGFVEQEGEEIEESEEEFEELEEDRGWNLKGVLNTLLVFLVLVLCTMYISSMNSPTPPPALQPIGNLHNEFWKIRNPLYGAVPLNCSVCGNEETEVDFPELSQRDSDEWAEVQNMVVVDEWVEAKDMVVVENSDELGEMLEPNGGGSEVVVEMFGGETNGTVCEMDGVLELQGGQIVDVCDDKVEMKWEDPDLMAESNGVQEIEASEKMEPFLDYQAPIMSDWALVIASEKEENADGDFKDEMEESQVVGGEISEEGYPNEEVAENEAERLVDTSDNEEAEVIILEIVKNEESNSKVINPDREVNSMEWVVEQIETESMAKLAIGFSAIFAVIASLVLGFHLKGKRTFDMGPSPSPGDNPCSGPVISKKNSSVVVNEGVEHIEKVESFVTPLNLSMEEASKEFYHSRAPTVELLGEFEVGELSTSSLKSCRKKSRMMESDLSNYSISQEEHSWRKGKSVPIQSLLEFSSMGSPSYGSFTAEKKIIKKEEGRDGEVRKVLTTPVRRSSRIHKRAVLSP